jgi:glycosyltransferase involved in cell wall biosynthesis
MSEDAGVQTGRAFFRECSRQARRILNGVAWRVKFRYKPAAGLLFVRLCERKSYRWLPVRLNDVQSSVVHAIASHPAYSGSLPSRSECCESVSVVIPHFNQQEFLPRTIESVLNQTEKPLEIIVVDDSSSDRVATRAVLDRYASEAVIQPHYPDRKLYCGGARNYGAGLAKGDIIAFVDSDDIMHPQRLEMLKILFREKPDATFAITGYLPFADSAPIPSAYGREDLIGSIIGPGEITRALGRSFARTKLSWVDKKQGKIPWYAWGGYGVNRNFPPHSGAIAARRDTWGIVPFNDPNSFVFCPYEDYEYCLFMQALTRGGYQIDLPLLFYRKGTTTNKPVEEIGKAFGG